MTPTPPADCRGVALRTLMRVRREDAYANRALAAELGRAALNSFDAALTTELVYGVLRRQRQLDHVLARHLKQPLKALDPRVVDVLRLTAYQLLFLGRVPSYAAVDYAVSRARKWCGRSIAGVANAVLRRVTKSDLENDLPDDRVQRLGIEASLPDALASLLVEQLGFEEARKFGEACLQPAPLTIRTNLLRTTTDALLITLQAEDADVERCSFATDGLRVHGLAAPFSSRTYRDGWWSAQDEAAQLIAPLFKLQQGSRVLDAAAGLGGKTAHLVDLLRQRGADPATSLVCLDLGLGKLRSLEQHLARLGYSASCVLGDASLDLPFRSDHFQHILLDAPCSGLGVLRRHPELKWRFSRKAPSRLAELQRSMLRSAVDRLAPGGELIYSICTFTREEGEDNVRWICDGVPSLQLEPLTAARLADLCDGPFLRTWPQRHNMDGFFAARLRKAK